MTWKLIAAFRTLLKRLKNDNKYRPERHYMRGSGPKSRAHAAQHRP